MGKLQDVQQPRLRKASWEMLRKVSRNINKLPGCLPSWKDRHRRVSMIRQLYSTYHILDFSMFPWVEPGAQVLGKDGTQTYPGVYIRHNKGKNSATCERSTKVSGNMDKQSGCLPLKIDIQWRCFYYSMNTSLFLVSISSVFVALLYQEGHCFHIRRSQNISNV